MTRSRSWYFIVCLVSATSWALLNQQCRGEVSDTAARENSDHRGHLESEKQENDHDPLTQSSGVNVKGATISEIKVRLESVGFAFDELGQHLATIRQEPGRERVDALLDDMDADFQEIERMIAVENWDARTQLGIREQIQQRLGMIQATIPERIQTRLQNKFPDERHKSRIAFASKAIFLLGTTLSLIVLYVFTKMSFRAVMNSGRIGFSLGVFGLTSILCGIYPIAGYVLFGLGCLLIVGHAVLPRKTEDEGIEHKRKVHIQPLASAKFGGT